MFAVPGWSVSPSLLKAEISEPKKGRDKPVSKPEKIEEAKAPEANGEVESNRSKKRKRSNESMKAKAVHVDVDNMEELWGTVVEGQTSDGKTKKGKKDKRRKTEGDAEARREKSKTTNEEGGDKNPEAAMEIGIEGQVPVAKERKKKGKTMKEKKREKKARLKAIAEGTLSAMSPSSETEPAPIPAPQPTKPTLTPLQASMRQKLISARFRHLNQTLYTTPSAHSLSLFAENPEMFTEYHEGFRRQVEVWPENPVDGYLSQLLTRGTIKGPMRGNPLNKQAPILEQALPRTENICTIADLGCGDAALSTKLQPHLKNLKIKIHSFDLQAPSPLVTKADIANLPLKDGTIDIAIFCLALMGTNWVDFIEEAYRILRWKGELWIAEIKSRFGRVSAAGKGKPVVSHSVGNRKRPLDKKAKKAADEAADDAVAAVEVDGQEDRGGETDVSAFVEVLRKRGFVLKGEGQGGEKESVDLRNKMFVRMCFVKGATPIKGKGVPAPKGSEEFGTKGARAGETWKKKAPMGVKKEEKGDEVHVSSEAGVLKPCVYKLR
ncbi:uncharacterized protein L3040_001915 [Drepanopeziza brunnea f. sp. 'multigermtubi']|uniref:Ribosomal RNA-processing protein 8 n=1 Tax=Marssonina brunnea f. sp. multigermtubi (strain MB_m1) TaxID=1072389 RepID=K1XFZ7_MARBU|nr:ribosomal RNA-processing protein 8 [Drepanopeziza brunnea f. sp. 'multigermtubi' MB_m1]EKD19738.1 ribosomal RNA-processing protein 8 [Drepanopeziza brunnea f. sp. 'multigermtubi' MB_m1]KAJ5052156.1 hypothetical protein L3040_001915 [Drepanopeziza brunnea f. sp. 'multigermtubi']